MRTFGTTQIPSVTQERRRPIPPLIGSSIVPPPRSSLIPSIASISTARTPVQAKYGTLPLTSSIPEQKIAEVTEEESDEEDEE